MPSTGATLPGSGTDTGTNWTSPGNITSDDNNVAELDGGMGESSHLRASQFGLSISASSIDGITVTFGAKYIGLVAETLIAQIRNGAGSLVGNQKTANVNATSETTYTLGGAADVWGTSLSQTDINDVDFGVELWANNGPSSTYYPVTVDWVKIDVTYTASGGTGTRSYFNWFYGGMGAAGGVTPSTKPWYFRKYVLGRRG